MRDSSVNKITTVLQVGGSVQIVYYHNIRRRLLTLSVKDDKLTIYPAVGGRVVLSNASKLKLEWEQLGYCGHEWVSIGGGNPKKPSDSYAFPMDSNSEKVSISKRPIEE